MSLEEELSIARDLVTARFQVRIGMPTIISGNDALRTYYPVKSLNDLMRIPPRMMYDTKKNVIFVSDVALRESKEDRVRYFAHELGHALVRQTNPEFERREDSVDQEKSVAARVFNEGIATYIELESCLPHRTYSETAQGRKCMLIKEKYAWCACRGFSLIKTPDYIKIQLEIFRKHPDAILSFQYSVGYFFVTKVIEGNIIALIKSPPDNVEELVYPEIYQERMQKKQENCS